MNETAEPAAVVATKWRLEAWGLEQHARELRGEGYTSEADDAEQAAADYRIAADDLEAAA